MKRIICVGACYIDTILTVPHYPGEDDKLRAKTLSRRRGGNCANTLEVLSSLIDAAIPYQDTITTASREDMPMLSLCAILPAKSSVATRFVQDSLPGVDFSTCLYREEESEAASSYIIRSEKTGSRTIVNYNGLAEMTIAEFVTICEDYGKADGWWHFEGRVPEVTLECIRHLRRHFSHSTISVEVEKPGREGLQELAAEADVVFYSRSWAQAFGFNSASQCLIAQKALMKHPKLLCCSWGEDGGSIIESPNQNCRSCSALDLPYSAVVDTIGAGDTFIAGIIFALLILRSDSPKQLEFAMELAGRKVMQEGFQGLGPAMTRWMRQQDVHQSG